MYKNTGSKIITMANVFAAISAIFGIVLGVTIGVGTGGIIGFAVGFLIAVLGCIIAWVGNLLIAGFGELVSNTHELLQIIKGDPPLVENGAKQAVSQATSQVLKHNNVVVQQKLVSKKEQQAKEWRSKGLCTKCGGKLAQGDLSDRCKVCGAEFPVTF